MSGLHQDPYCQGSSEADIQPVMLCKYTRELIYPDRKGIRTMGTILHNTLLISAALCCVPVGAQGPSRESSPYTLSLKSSCIQRRWQIKRYEREQAEM